jgi:hypothetical protein
VIPLLVTKKAAFHYCDKIPEMNNSKDKIFTLAHNVSGYNMWSVGPVPLGLWGIVHKVGSIGYSW